MASLPPSAVASDNTAAAPPVTAVWAIMFLIIVALSPVFSTRVLVVGEKGQSCEKDPLRRRTLKRLPARFFEMLQMDWRSPPSFRSGSCISYPGVCGLPQDLQDDSFQELRLVGGRWGCHAHQTARPQ